MDSIVSAACDLLEKGRPFVLATIIFQQGSTPRTAGTRMLITAEKEIFGTIGGGLLEGQTMATAAAMNGQEPGRYLTFDLTNKDAANTDMICGGRVKVLCDYIRPDAENQALFNAWRTELSHGRKAMLVTIVSGSETHIEHLDHVLLFSDHRVQGSFEISDEMRGELSGLAGQAGQIQVLKRQGSLFVVDPGQAAPTLYIFGAGHVAQPTAHLAAMVGFSVVVLDDRSEFANAARFPDAAATRTLSSYETAFEGLTVNAESYVIIVTRGHLHDRTVLAQALKTPAAYIGMIGSRRKRNTIYERLRKDGYTDADIARVHCPIGLSIGADTPEEIGVSIVAELIAKRAGARAK
jgi:xanthine dehydrogenase accessory factor